MRPLVAGAILCVVGLAVLAIGALVSLGDQVRQVVAAEGRAPVTDDVTFDAEEATYAILLLRNPTGPDYDTTVVTRVECEVSQPDGSTLQVDGDSATVRVETDAGTQLASFEGQPGETTVSCGWDGSRGQTESSLGYVFSVAEAGGTARWLGTGLTLGGIAVTLIGVLPVVVGFRGRVVVDRLDT